MHSHVLGGHGLTLRCIQWKQCCDEATAWIANNRKDWRGETANEFPPNEADEILVESIPHRNTPHLTLLFSHHSTLPLSHPNTPYHICYISDLFCTYIGKAAAAVQQQRARFGLLLPL